MIECTGAKQDFQYLCDIGGSSMVGATALGYLVFMDTSNKAVISDNTVVSIGGGVSAQRKVEQRTGPDAVVQLKQKGVPEKEIAAM